MACACRSASWRSFINGLAQVHRLDGHAHLSPRGIRPASPRLHQPLVHLRHARSFHDTMLLNQEATAETPVIEHDASLQKQSDEAAHADKDASLPAIAKPRKSGPENPRSQTTSTQSSAPKKRGPKPKNLSFESEGRASRYASPNSSDRKFRPKKGGEALNTQRHEAKMEAEADSQQMDPNQNKPHWMIQKEVLKKKFPGGWAPRKRLSPDALAGIRALNAQFPDVYTTQALADKFEVSAESIRRILRSKWQPNADEEVARDERWHRRGKQIWETRAALGVKPPSKWRREGITRDPSFHARRERGIQRENDWEEEERRKYRESRPNMEKEAGDKKV